MEEIHKSKMSYCWLASPAYHQFDIILNDVNEITPKTVLQAKTNRSERIKAQSYAQAIQEQPDHVSYRNKPKQRDFEVEIQDIPDHEIVFRVMTYEHIPDEMRRKNPKNESEEKSKVNFPPFKHYAYDRDGQLWEVARSHWRGDLATGEFCLTHGALTDKLAMMYMKLVERYSHRSNWRSYSYLDEMRGEALLQLSQVGLKFNEDKSQNPFSYYTASITNCFTKILNTEKRHQSIRDDILQEQGHDPSFSRQLDNEISMMSSSDQD